MPPPREPARQSEPLKPTQEQADSSVLPQGVCRVASRNHSRGEVIGPEDVPSVLSMDEADRVALARCWPLNESLQHKETGVCVAIAPATRILRPHLR